mgnify:CR=1 FL=1
MNHNIYTWDDNVIFPQSVVVFDLNSVREVNDKLGREAGDEVIKKVAGVLINNQLENTDIIRSGGDEFLIYMIGYEEKKVVEYTKNLVKEMKSIPNSFGVECGYSMILDEVKTVDDAINEAIIMMNKNSKLEWRVAAYMAIWTVVAALVKWAIIQMHGISTESVIGHSLIGVFCMTCAIIISFIEKHGKTPFLWLKRTPSNQHWAMPGLLGAFTNSGSIAGVGIGFMAKNISQAIILYGIVTVMMLLQRLFVEMEQTKVEQEYLYKECVAVRGFDFEGPVDIGTERHRVRIVRGQKAEKGDYLVIIGMKGFTFVVDKL